MQTVKKKDLKVNKNKTKKPKTRPIPTRWRTCTIVTVVAKDGEN